VSRSDRPRLIAIGIDAAEPTHVRRLLERGDLPALRDLAGNGMWGPVVSPAPIGSGAVWPTFLTGRSPSEHGLHGEWVWRPDVMSLGPLSWDHLDPFWRVDIGRDRRVTILDVPFAPRLGVPGGVEVLDWGAHDRLTGRLQVSPSRLEATVMEAGGVHPFAAESVHAAGPTDRAGLARVVTRCLAGVAQRGRLARRLLADMTPDLFLGVFTELHRASHLLWHTVDPGHPDHAAEAPRDRPDEGLVSILAAIDREIGRLREGAGPESALVVFSLHGMRRTRGIPTILGPLLEAHGFAVPQAWRGRSVRERAAGALTAVKRMAPDAAKRFYHRWLPRKVTGLLTQPSMPMPAYDWSRTTAFALPTDQHGWVRVNLRGREALGIVEPDRYADVCWRVEEALRAARRTDGQPVVRAVLRTAADAGAAATSRLPDLVIHWDDATFASPLRIAEPALTAPSVGLQFTGQHAPAGFYLLRRPEGRAASDGPPVTAERLHHLLRETAGWSD
jgi:predicted AlkP superfamily phosphohydrolase/phosphomutase